MKKVIAIVFSDLHLGKYNKFNQEYKRTLSLFRVLFDIRKICNKYKVPAIFCGDLLHKQEVIENDFYSILTEKFLKLDRGIDDVPGKKFVIYAISGNHDMNVANSISKRSSSWVNTLSKQYRFIRCIDFKNEMVGVGGFSFRLHGVPYIDHNNGLNEYIKNIPIDDKVPNILMLHTDYPGAKDTDGVEVNSVENLNINLLKKFDLVLIGHIHKPQRLSKKVYMVGAPCQQRRTDKDCSLGYWELYDDLTMKFIPLQDYPKFIDVPTENEVKDDGNYYTMISQPSRDREEVVENKINTKLSPKRLVRRYLKSRSELTDDKQSILLNLIKDSSND